MQFGPRTQVGSTVHVTHNVNHALTVVAIDKTIASSSETWKIGHTHP